MKGFFATRSFVLLVAGAAVVATLALASPPVRAPESSSMDFWEAAGRGLVSVVMVNETFTLDGHEVTQPAGIRVTNLATVPVVIPEEAVLMNPHPSQSPSPNPLNTTADAVLTQGTVPAQGSLLYSFGAYVLGGFLSDPPWWDLEEMQFSKAGVVFKVGGETLPLALRSFLEHPFYTDPGTNTQTALWAYLRSYPMVVVGKQPLWTAIHGTGGETVRVRVDATNLAVWATDDTFTKSVNVTKGIVEDDVPVGWSVEEGSFSVPPDLTVSHSDGSQTLEWVVTIPGAQVSQQGSPFLPTAYAGFNSSYTLVAPALDSGSLTLPRARSDMNDTGSTDAQSAPVTITVVGNAPPVADAGGPYTGNEGDTIVLNASKSSDPEHDPLQYRWSFTDNGTWDTSWSPDPAASVHYTDEFAGQARVEVTDGHTIVDAFASVTITNVPPAIRSLTASASGQAGFRLIVAGEKSHDVTFHLFANGTELTRLPVTRTPGNPLQQSAETGLLTLDLTKPVLATVLYSGSGPSSSGRSTGDNPAWLVITLANGSAVRLFHNFNGQHEATWNWSLGDLRDSVIVRGIALRAHLFDPGADGLTAHWDFGDGTSATQVFPNGPASDAPEAVVGGAAPMDVVAGITHTYPSGMTFTVTLTVTDADGASATASLTVQSS